MLLGCIAGGPGHLQKVWSCDAYSYKVIGRASGSRDRAPPLFGAPGRVITSPPHCQTPLPTKPSLLKFHRFPLLYGYFPFLISQIQAWQFYHRNHLKSMPFNPSTCGEKCSDRSQAGPKKHAVAQDLIIGYSIGSLSSRGSIALVFFLQN